MTDIDTKSSGGATPAGGIQPYVPYAQEMDALFQIGVAITSESTVEQVLQSILDECRRVLPVDTLYVALYDEESDSYEIPIFYDVGQYRSIERKECKAVRSLTCEVIAQRSALYIPDTHDLGAMSFARSLESAPCSRLWPSSRQRTPAMQGLRRLASVR